MKCTYFFNGLSTIVHPCIDIKYFVGKCLFAGEIASVSGTLFDLRQPVLLGSRMNKVVEGLPGFDHNFCVNGSGDKKLAAR